MLLDWRPYMAGTLLYCGVQCVLAGTWFLAIPGFICFLVAPMLVAGAAVDEAVRRRGR